jgi:hypothetical protein
MQNAQKQKQNDEVVQQFSTNFIELRQEFLTQKSRIVMMSLTVISSQNQRPSPSPAVKWFNSRIISDFPDILAEFRVKQLRFRSRGNSNGFKAQEFHRRSDPHANTLILTLTLISDMKKNIINDSTSLNFDRSYSFKTDDNLKSFAFTVKNEHPVEMFGETADEM